jgi:hypothetical protein
MINQYYYSCFIHNGRTSWRCEMHNSFVEAQRTLEAYKFINYYGNFFGQVVPISSVWPGFVRRLFLHFNLFFPITIEEN